MSRIHPTAIIDSQAEIGEDVEIGPYCVITGAVHLARAVRLVGQVHLAGPLHVGEGCVVWPFAVLGCEPQDWKFKPGDPTAGVRIGANCLIREHATVHASTRADRPTRVGDSVFMMQGAHVGHDAQVGNHVVLVNNALIAGHAEVHDRVNFSGAAAVHQFARIGRCAMLSGGTGLSRDVPPFCTSRVRNRIAGINSIGMRRAGYSREDIRGTQVAYRDLLRQFTPQEELIAELERRSATCPPLADMAIFIRETKRGLCASEQTPPPGFSAWMRLHESKKLPALDDQSLAD